MLKTNSFEEEFVVLPVDVPVAVCVGVLHCLASWGEHCAGGIRTACIDNLTCASVSSQTQRIPIDWIISDNSL